MKGGVHRREDFRCIRTKQSKTMLRWAIGFLVIAIIAAFLGFGGIAGTAATIAQVLFVLFLILFVVALFMGRTAL